MGVLGNRWSMVLKGAFADRLVFATAFLVVLLAATLVSAIPIYANAVAESSLRERLARAPATAANVQATVSVFGGGGDQALDESVRSVARDAFGATGVAVYRSAESEPFSAQGRTVVFGYFDGLADHAQVVDGRWPAEGERVEVVVPEAVARSLDLEVGEAITARSRLSADRLVSATVVGVYRAVEPASAYWWASPLATGALGPLTTTRESFFALGLDDVELRWRLQPDIGRLAVDEAAALRRRLEGIPGRLNVGRPEGEQFAVETELPDILAGAERSLRLARAGVLVPSIQLALLAAYGLIVTAVLLLERRRFTTESLRLRGATTAQVVRAAAVEATLIAVPAVIVAPWVAAASLKALNYAGPLTDVGLRLQPSVSTTAYVLAAASGAICVAGLVLPALWARRAAVVRERRRVPVAQFAQRVGLDVMLAVLALIGYWQLRRYHGFLLEHRGALDIDPFLVAAPALLLLAGALLSLRVVPLGAALIERFVPSTQGTVAALGFWQLARRPRTYARSVLLLVLAVAIGVFAATYSETWHRSQLDQAAHAAAADILVEPSDRPGTPGSTELASAYRSLGVEEALPVVTDSFDLARSGAEESGTLLALDARRAGDVVRVRDDFAERPLGELFGPLSEERAELATLALPGRPTRIAFVARLHAAGRAAPTSGFRAGPVFGSGRRASRSFYVYLRDGDGVLHGRRLGELPPGPERRFTLELGQARYPLELVGFELDVGVPYFVSRRMSFEVALEAGGRRVSTEGPEWRASVTDFDFPYERARLEAVSAAGGSLRATLRTGSCLCGTGETSFSVAIRPGRDSIPSAPPVLASDTFLQANSASLGDVVPLALTARDQDVRIVGSFHRFSTLEPSTPSVVADLPTYYAFSFARNGSAPRPAQWWLTADRNEEVAQQLRTAPFQSLDVVSRTQRERALLEDPVPLGVIGALALGFVVAAAFAAVGFAASAAASARARMLEFAVLRSLGLRVGQLSGWIALESALVVVVSLVGGTALGLLVAWLVLPYVALGTSGAEPVPPVLVSVPWMTLLWLELALLGALAVVSAFQVLRVRGLRPAQVLRSGEGTVAP